MKQHEMKKITQFMKVLLQNSPGCVPQPFEVIDKNAPSKRIYRDVILKDFLFWIIFPPMISMPCFIYVFWRDLD